jgi:uncharacterized protein with GYD domain
MKRTHIAKIALFSAFIFSTPTFCAQDNPITSMIMGNINRMRDWTNSFYTTCRDVGIVATIYATFGIYDFNKITGLDENKLDTYDIQQLKTAQQRVETMNIYALRSSALNALNKFSTTIQGQIQQKEDKAQAASDEAKMMKEVGLSYSQAEDVESIKKIRAAKK